METIAWIWPAEAKGVNSFIDLRHGFRVDRPIPSATLSISADSHYTVWINGQFVGTGQYTGFPDQAFYDRYEVAHFLREGRNFLAISAHCCGVDHFSYIASNSPGVIYQLRASDEELSSSNGGEIQVRLNPAYRHGEMVRITNQLPFTFEFEAAHEDGWSALDFAATDGWRALTEGDFRKPQSARKVSASPIAHWEVKDRSPAEIIAQGLFRPSAASPADQSVGREMQRAFLSSRSQGDLFLQAAEGPIKLKGEGAGPQFLPQVENAYVIVDLGREESGFIEIEFAAARRTTIDIAYGQHLATLRVLAEVGGRNFASRYHTRSGRQVFTHWGVRASGRYLQLNLHGDLSDFCLHYAGLRPAVWPVEVRGAFQSVDRLENKTFEIATRTLQLCMHEHYEDTPWREQGLYANDALIQALCGYYAFGEYGFPAFSFQFLGESLQPDGWLELCAPARIPITIPSFSMAWIMAQSDHLLYSGDSATAAAALAVVGQMLDTYASQCREDLLPSPTGPRFWHFYDWMNGLDGCGASCSEFLTLEQLRFDAPLNAMFVLALEAGSFLADHVGEKEKANDWRRTAQQVRVAFHHYFWHLEEGFYSTYNSTDGGKESFSELTQALAVCAEISETSDQSARLRKRISDPNNGLIPSTLSQSLYTLRALAIDSQTRPLVLNRIRDTWGKMVLQGATSFWETEKGAWDFDGAGSLCHGWSTLPLYAFGAWILGIRPVEPGFRKFTVDPDPILAPGRSGCIPTPHGLIEVSYILDPNGKIIADLKYPAGTSPIKTSIVQFA